MAGGFIPPLVGEDGGFVDGGAGDGVLCKRS